MENCMKFPQNNSGALQQDIVADSAKLLKESKILFKH